jgi:hypothetical protein
VTCLETKYVEVSDESESKGDPDIFNDEDDDEGGPMEKASIAQPTEPTVTAPRKPLPPANHTHGSKEGATMVTSNGEGREDDTEGGKRKEAAISKGMKKSKNKDGANVSGEIQGSKNKGTNLGGKDKEGEIVAINQAATTI